MNIETVDICNINTLYSLFTEIKHTEVYKDKTLGRNMNNLLEHMSISMVVSDISILDAFYLKQFAKGEFILENVEFENKEDDELSKIIDSLSSIIKAMNNDTDISVKPGNLFYTAKNLRCKCRVLFTGTTLCNIFSAIPERFFASIFPTFEEKVLLDNRPNEDLELLQNEIIKSFIINFTKFCNERTNYIDLLSDYGVEKEYYIYNQDSLCTLSTVQTMVGGFNLAARDTDDLAEQLQLIKAKVLDLGEEKFLNTTKLIFTCHTSLELFLHLFLAIDIDYIVDYEDIKKVISKNEYTFPEYFLKYKTRLSEKLTNLYEYKNKYLENLRGNIDSQKYNSIALNSIINFSLKVSFKDINELVDTSWIDQLLLNDDDTNKTIRYDMTQLMREIYNQKSIVLNNFFK